jgi:hypothetical protein
MSNKKITPQILGMYFGQEVEYGDMHCKIISISIGGVITVRSNGHSQDVEAALCKPILRPLSDMAEEEVIECGKLFCPEGFNRGMTVKISSSSNTKGAHFQSPVYTSDWYYSIFTDGKPDKIGHIEQGWLTPKRKSDQYAEMKKEPQRWKIVSYHNVTVWLISKGFDLFGLIESGLAIKQTNDTP